jgi:hypothetical protein
MKTIIRIFSALTLLLFLHPQAVHAQNCLASYTFTITGSTVYFTSTSTGVTGNAAYVWDFGDSNTGIGQTVQYTYSQPAVYYVCLTVIDSACTNQFCDSVVLPANCPPAGFTYFANGNSVSFAENVNVISPNSTWFWTFGDGNFSTQQNPTHNYFATGTYNVCVSYYDPVAQCQDSSCMPVNVGPAAIPDLPDAAVPVVYPNPFNGQLQVICNGILQRISITDVTGRRLLDEAAATITGGTFVFETAGLRPGVYLLQCTTAAGTFTQKIVRE